MLKGLWPRRSVADSEDKVLFYTAHILTETAFKAFVWYIFSCSIANAQILYQSYPFRRRRTCPFQILHRPGFSCVGVKTWRTSDWFWDFRTPHKAHKGGAGWKIHASLEWKPLHRTCFWSKVALERYKGTFFYKDWSAQPQLWGTLVSEGWENSHLCLEWDVTAMKIPEEHWSDLKIGSYLKIQSTSQIGKAILLPPVLSGNQHHQKALSFQQTLAGTEHVPSTCLDVDGTERNTSATGQSQNFPALSQEVGGHHSSLHLGSISLFAQRAPKNCLSQWSEGWSTDLILWGYVAGRTLDGPSQHWRQKLLSRKNTREVPGSFQTCGRSEAGSPRSEKHFSTGTRERHNHCTVMGREPIRESRHSPLADPQR